MSDNSKTLTIVVTDIPLKYFEMMWNATSQNAPRVFDNQPVKVNKTDQLSFSFIKQIDARGRELFAEVMINAIALQIVNDNPHLQSDSPDKN